MRHRVRQRVMRERTALANQIRGFLLDFGLPVARGRAVLRRRLPAILEDGDNGLGDRGRALSWALWQELQDLDERVAVLDQQIAAECQADTAARRLRTVPGIGPLTATATVAAIGEGGDFDRARGFAAWLGLVPRHDGTGGQCADQAGPEAATGAAQIAYLGSGQGDGGPPALQSGDRHRGVLLRSAAPVAVRV